MSDGLDCPLLQDRVAEKDSEAIEREGPDHDKSADTVHPDPQLVGEDAHVQSKLAHLQGCEAPDVDQCEREGEPQDNWQIVHHCVTSQTCIILQSRLTRASGRLQSVSQNPIQPRS